ncbi:hypothetical protein F751_0081 [Auxenochlorella protothecoides]|uniref:Hydroxyproline O-arabinosyltransferase-like domain-containing protein n=1 Tax=Auxenochlorella protothecoides TaxID=3075 RepID=A0A087S9G7_AUXPR|nr:hypothetical protein F751_0081 [Auxenochlorella protothecoides]KFM22371.1 hypothetical protein F751_0081 [Auxenochlorella protothecoides]
MWLEQTLSSSRRRVLIILTLLAVTLTYSIFSVGRLSELAGSAAQREPADGSLNPSIWVYCEDAGLCGKDHKACWLKHLAHPTAVEPSKKGPNVGWTSGFITRPRQTRAAQVPADDDRRYHTVITAQGSAVHWQSRVGYYWFLKTKRDCQAAGKRVLGVSEGGVIVPSMPPEMRARGPGRGMAALAAASGRPPPPRQGPAWGGQAPRAEARGPMKNAMWSRSAPRPPTIPPPQMGGFTRLLHSGKEDDLMAEIPTWVAQPLPPEHPDHGYVVLNRPYALLQWIKGAVIPEKYVLMSEPDHVWLKPMPNLMTGTTPAAFPFFYIEPSKKEFLPIVQKFVGPISRVEAEEIAPIGNAPTFMSVADMKNVMPIWFNISIAVHNDEAASKAWGWVQEMYAFTLSCYKAGIRDISLFLKARGPCGVMTSQPPWDSSMDPYYILHYTYGMDYTKEGVFTPGKIGEWRFDKRAYSLRPPPRNLGEPPEGMKNDLVRHLIHAINEASSIIPDWDDYSATGVAKQFWDGKTFATA